MNPDILQDVQKRLTIMEERISSIQKLIERFKIDKQTLIQRSGRLKPGIACKVAYNTDGVITGTSELTQTDVPQLSIDKIDGLASILEDKASSTDVQKIKRMLDDVYRHGDSVDTGCKVNIDDHGFVVSTSSLLVEDIPTLPIDKIDGLSSVISQLSARPNTDSMQIDKYKINAGSGCKINYDEYGRVVGSDNLSMEDIPNELLSRLNIIEGRLADTATHKALSNLTNLVMRKVDSNSTIAPGTYTKVSVDRNGLVTLGDSISISDLPEIQIDNILDLRRSLNEKASRSEVSELSQSVSSMVSTVTRLGDIRHIKDSFKQKVDNSDFLALKNQVNELRDLLNRTIVNIPGDQILNQLSIVESELNTIAGRLSNLEKEMAEFKITP